MTRIEANQLFLSLEKGDFADHAADTAPNVLELWAAIRGASECGVATLEGAEHIAGRSQWEYPTPGQFDAFLAGLDANVRIRGEGHDYRLKYEFHSDHDAGEGGTTLAVTQLVCDDAPVLVSLSRTSYATLSDDSEDYPTDRRDDLYLLDRDDALAVAVFEGVIPTAPRKPR